jgi:membrane protein implicated in regulation of membrane protease activity
MGIPPITEVKVGLVVTAIALILVTPQMPYPWSLLFAVIAVLLILLAWMMDRDEKRGRKVREDKQTADRKSGRMLATSGDIRANRELP